MKRFIKWFALALVLAVLACAGGAFALYRRALTDPLPQLEGTLKAAGLHAQVEVLHDAWGIPHIYAQNHHDLMFAQGYVQAQDRWWQMDFYRRVFTGRMSEIAGKSPDAQKVDVLMRTLDLKTVAQRDYESLEPALKEYYDAFCEGVNAWREAREPSRMAVQYAVLGLTGKKLEPEPWTPADSLAFGKLMGYVFSGRDLEREPLLALLREKLSDAEWALWDPPYPYGEQPTTINPEDLPQLDGLAPSASYGPSSPSPDQPRVTSLPDQSSLMDLLPQGIPGAATREASNAWALSGEHTNTSKPLFASDPHHGIEMPGLWYEIGLHCPADKGRDALNLYGYAAAMLPFVCAGNNDRICWGLTNVSGSDCLDLFELKLNPDNPNQYEWDGQWRNLELRETSISIAGAEPLNLTVRQSHLGPLMPEQLLPEGNKGKAWAICWAGLREGTIQRAGIELVFARNFDEFHEALRWWDYPAANIPYADVEGNIGFQQAGKFPYGPGHAELHGPLPGWESGHEWQGFIPYDLLPHVLNPRSGMVIAANNPVVPAAYAAYVAAQLHTSSNTDTAPLTYMGYRAGRIAELLGRQSKHDLESLKIIQTDSAMPALARLLHQALQGQPVSEGASLLLQWDGTMDTDKSAPLLAALFLQRLMVAVFEDELELKTLLQPDTTPFHTLELMVAQRDSTPFWDDKRTPQVETMAQVIGATLAQAEAEARDRFGNTPSAWEWGKLHVYNFVDSVLGKSGVGPLEALVNRRALPAPGGFASINNARWVELPDGQMEVRTIPSYRRIMDLSNFDNSIAINSSGQSAHPGSEHYDDQMPLWAKGEYRPINWSRKKVEAATVHRLLLEP